MEIFGDDTAKCDKLNELLCKKAGFSGCYDVSTQTYTRKVDLIVANAIAGLGSTAQKIAGDIRHLATFKEIEEPFEKDQSKNLPRTMIETRANLNSWIICYVLQAQPNEI